MTFVKPRKMRERYKNKSLLKLLINFLRNENGNVLIIVALLAIIMFGFTALVVDGGMLYRERNILQKTVDAAALAGVQGLNGQKKDTNAAEEVAREYVLYNYDGLKGEVSEENVKFDFPEDYYTIKVTADIDTNLWFARVLSDKWKLPFNVSATATATKEPGYGPMPLGIYDDVWQFYDDQSLPKLGDLILLKGSKLDILNNTSGQPYVSPDVSGWFDIVGPDATKKNIGDYVSEGMPGCVGVGDVVFQLNGQSLGNVEAGLEKRYIRAASGDCRRHPGGCPDDPFLPQDAAILIGNSGEYTYKDLINADAVYNMYKECPRFLLIPIVNKVSLKNGVKEFKLTEFVIAYLKDDDGDKQKIEGWYLGKLTVSEDDPCLASSRYARLIK